MKNGATLGTVNNTKGVRIRKARNRNRVNIGTVHNGSEKTETTGDENCGDKKKEHRSKEKVKCEDWDRINVQIRAVERENVDNKIRTIQERW